MGHNDGMTSIEMGPFPDVSGYEEAVALDASDPLSAFRDRYLHTDPDLVYLDGNSLGRAPIAALDLVGVPWQLIVGPKGVADGVVEIKRRATGERQTLPLDAAIRAIAG